MMANPEGKTPKPNDGLRKIRTTTAFRIVNPELFIRPNKYVMTFGAIAITGCILFLALMRASHQGNARGEYADTTIKRKSRWD
ncbi:Small integral membrane protein 8 [Trichoplax sp. H2]|nr:Small integral membrane protein 8 [Trichoplax sp. H2]|eukprot:RDD43529.1 Small integral membrane protein 8 [Trichoplax sp. H2]